MSGRQADRLPGGRRPEFTGERLPDDDPRFRADLARHLAAYHIARGYCAGKTVLDAGCGEGYGAALLATAARRVVGVDRDWAAVAHARARQRRPNLSFACVDLEKLASRGITVDQFADALRQENLNVSAGAVPQGKRDISVRAMGQYDDPQQIRETVVGWTDSPITGADGNREFLVHAIAAGQS